MSLRSLSKYRSEANYAHSHRKFGGCSSKQVKLLRKATKAYNRCVRRSQREVIAEELSLEKPSDTPVIAKPFHCVGVETHPNPPFGWWENDWHLVPHAA